MTDLPGKPYLARCAHPLCRKTRESFETEKEQLKWGTDHRNIFGDDHKVGYARKAVIQ